MFISSARAHRRSSLVTAPGAGRVGERGAARNVIARLVASTPCRPDPLALLALQHQRNRIPPYSFSQNKYPYSRGKPLFQGWWAGKEKVSQGSATTRFQETVPSKHLTERCSILPLATSRLRRQPRFSWVCLFTGAQPLFELF